MFEKLYALYTQFKCYCKYWFNTTTKSKSLTYEKID